MKWRTLIFVIGMMLISLTSINLVSGLLTDGIYAYYNFDESSGTTANDRGSNNYDLIVGNSTGWVVGRVNGSYAGNNSENINTSIIESLYVINELTINMWIRRTGDWNTSGYMLAKNPAPVNGDYVIARQSNTNKIQFSAQGSGAYIHTFSDSDILPDTWYMLTVMVNSTHSSIYIDGVMDKNSSITGFTGNSFSPYFMSSYDGLASSYGVNTTIDELGFWNRELNNTEISDLYNSGNGQSPFVTFTTLISPIDNFVTVSRTNTFNCSASQISNMTLYINGVAGYNINETDSLQSIETLEIGSHKWGCYMENINGTFLSNNRTINISSYLENSNTFNATTYETAQESFILNITYPSSDWISISATLNYAGTSYAGLKTGTGDDIIFTRTLQIPIGTGVKATNWTISFVNSTGTFTENTTAYTQTVGEIRLGFCNSTLNMPYVNFTFKDEETSNFMSAFVDASTWSYWLGDGSVTKSFTFSNTSGQNPSYAFCFSPQDRTLNANLTFKYSNTTHPQRTFTSNSATLTNVTTNTLLYLLGSGDGIYSSISVIESAGTAISGVSVTIERRINNLWTVVGQATTGDDGLATFWVNPNFLHRVTAIKIGYIATTVTFTPSQSLYTLTLPTSAGDASYSSNIPGLSWILNPGSGSIKPGSQNFNVTITSSIENLQNCKLELIEATNLSNILASGTDSTNSTYCNINFDYIVIKDLNFFGRLSVDTTNTTGFVIVDSDWKWIAIDIDTKSWRSITSFFSDIRSISEFGEGNEGEFSQIIVFFILTTIFVGMFSYFTGSELTNPGMNIFIVWIIVIIASVGGFLTFNSGSDNVSVTMEKFGFLLITTLFVIGYGLNLLRRANE